MNTPGRPVSPTIHRRTRPEGEEVARKMRATHDWFRHDGKNVDEPAHPPSRLRMPEASEIAARNKQDSEKWYGHDMTPTPMQPNKRYSSAASEGQDLATNAAAPKQSPKIKGPDPEAKENFKKIAGTEEAWYKFDDNQDWHTPRQQDRLQGSGSKENKMKNKGNPTSWYRHEHSPGDEAPDQRMTPRKGAGTPQPGSGDWYRHDNPVETTPSKSGHKGHGREAEAYLERGRHGTACDWYGHDSTPSKAQVSPRGSASSTAKNKSESGNWFSHDANQDYTEPTRSPRCPTQAAKDMYNRSQGSLGSVFNQTPQKSDIDAANGHERIGEAGQSRVSGALAQEVAKRNVQGVIMKYLDEDDNVDYNSPRPGARIKKGEAEDNYAKNQGNMGDMLGGYPDAPQKRNNRRVKPEAADYAERNKGTLDVLMNNYGNLPAQESPRGGRIKPEGAEYAERNKGSMSNIIGGYSDMSIR